MKQSNTIGLAIVGSGRIGSLRARIASEHPAVRFLAVSDIESAKARKLAETVSADAWSADNFEIISHPEVNAVVVNVDRKTRNIQLSIKQKDMIDEQGAMATLSQQSARENAGTTSLGALLRAKLDNSEK